MDAKIDDFIQSLTFDGFANVVAMYDEYLKEDPSLDENPYDIFCTPADEFDYMDEDESEEHCIHCDHAEDYSFEEKIEKTLSLTILILKVISAALGVVVMLKQLKKKD